MAFPFSIATSDDDGDNFPQCWLVDDASQLLNRDGLTSLVVMRSLAKCPSEPLPKSLTFCRLRGAVPWRRRLLAWFDDAKLGTCRGEGRATCMRFGSARSCSSRRRSPRSSPTIERFLARFPDVQSLAAADEREVLRLWEGLGYYRRARQLHAAAKQVVTEHGGRFPTSYDAVRSLPGIGRYTAGAILSIGTDARLPILEANTIRVLSRLMAFRGEVGQHGRTEAPVVDCRGDSAGEARRGVQSVADGTGQ